MYRALKLCAPLCLVAIKNSQNNIAKSSKRGAVKLSIDTVTSVADTCTNFALIKALYAIIKAVISFSRLP